MVFLPPSARVTAEDNRDRYEGGRTLYIILGPFSALSVVSIVFPYLLKEHSFRDLPRIMQMVELGLERKIWVFLGACSWTGFLCLDVVSLLCPLKSC